VIRARETMPDPDQPTWHGHLRLLRAMTGLGSPSLAATAHTRLAQATKALPRAPHSDIGHRMPGIQGVRCGGWWRSARDRRTCIGLRH
jgi:hypothetical protein